MFNLLETPGFLQKWFEFENGIYRLVPYLLAMILLGAIVKLIEKKVRSRKQQ